MSKNIFYSLFIILFIIQPCKAQFDKCYLLEYHNEYGQLVNESVFPGRYSVEKIYQQRNSVRNSILDTSYYITKKVNYNQDGLVSSINISSNQDKGINFNFSYLFADSTSKNVLNELELNTVLNIISQRNKKYGPFFRYSEEVVYEIENDTNKVIIHKKSKVKLSETNIRGGIPDTYECMKTEDGKIITRLLTKETFLKSSFNKMYQSELILNSDYQIESLLVSPSFKQYFYNKEGFPFKIRYTMPVFENEEDLMPAIIGIDTLEYRKKIVRTLWYN